ncbi:uncharacterized protein LOC129407423 [Boleophthalmus pectinirostris]|uniref:uncharacterized protein LOC129407423 n=1 Tax=Boleophthalmus pectinirostris TaxID=150288 RepID=UPI0024308732|nr:uncharacterized protein LOC129407423 [Boleophthalmus pectinirostris]
MPLGRKQRRILSDCTANRSRLKVSTCGRKTKLKTKGVHWTAAINFIANKEIEARFGRSAPCQRRERRRHRTGGKQILLRSPQGDCKNGRSPQPIHIHGGPSRTTACVSPFKIRYRYCAYRCLVSWRWGWLCRRVRVVLPYCEHVKSSQMMRGSLWAS